MKKHHIVLAILLIAISIVVYSGCTRTSPVQDASIYPSESPLISQMQSPPESSTTATPSVSQSLPTSDWQKKTIYYIAPTIGSYGTLTPAGVAQASKDVDCDFILQGVLDTDAERQVLLIENAVSSDADAIIIKVVDSEAVAGAVSWAYQSGIPIVLIGGLAGTEDYSTCLIIDDFKVGSAAAAEMLRKLRDTGLSEDDNAEIAIQIGAADPQATIDRLEGFREHWDLNSPSKWAVLWEDIKVNGGDLDIATENGYEFLDKYPNIKGFFAPNNGSTIGFATALMESNRTDITLVGFDISPEMQNIIRNRDFNASTMMPLQYKMGYDSIIIAYELANGGVVTEKTIDVGVLVVDIKNINEDNEVEIWKYVGQ